MAEQVPMKFRGMRAEVVVELHAKHGIIRVPVGDLAGYTESAGGFGEIRLPVRAPLMERLTLAAREHDYRLGP